MKSEEVELERIADALKKEFGNVDLLKPIDDVKEATLYVREINSYDKEFPKRKRALATIELKWKNGKWRYRYTNPGLPLIDKFRKLGVENE